MQYSLRYATLLLVAFSLALASSSWFPPLGSGATLILLIVGLRLIFHPAWLRATVWGAALGAIAFSVGCVACALVAGEPFLPRHYSDSQFWVGIARRYAIPVGGVAGGTLGHAFYAWNERANREEDVTDEEPDDESQAA